MQTALTIGIPTLIILMGILLNRQDYLAWTPKLTAYVQTSESSTARLASMMHAWMLWNATAKANQPIRDLDGLSALTTIT